ncbi:hypothetical protein [Ohtaekwangia sp.]|uniref:hypothetical protein n=1 Tax=Ohtaekwangia sp. TaxID=2066019 RepID=UPI002F92D59C
MNQQPDKLFHQKLESFSRPAPARAWDRIEAGLDKKNNKATWWKVAASLLLLLVAGYILWLSVKGNVDSASQPVMSHNASQPAEISPAETQKAQATSPPQTIKEADHQMKHPIYTAKSTEPVTQKAIKSIALEDKNTQPAIIETPKQEVAEVIPQHEKTENNIAATETPAPVIVKNESIYTSQRKGITLVITSAETDNYLNKNVSDEATDEDDKPSTFKKLLQRAQDLTNNQDPVGELRQKKNEILALNFKTEKRGQNK